MPREQLIQVLACALIRLGPQLQGALSRCSEVYARIPPGLLPQICCRLHRGAKSQEFTLQVRRSSQARTMHGIGPVGQFTSEEPTDDAGHERASEWTENAAQLEA